MQQTALKPVVELTDMQQQVLRAILDLGNYTFTTSNIQAQLSHIDGEALGGVLGSLYRIGFIDKLASGRDKKWRIVTEVVERQSELRFDLLAVDAGATESRQPTPRSSTELIAELQKI